MAVSSTPAMPVRLSFGLFGPPIAWLIHLIAAALIAEWGCLAGGFQSTFAGISAVAWGVIVVTVVTVLVAGAGTWAAWSVYQHQRNNEVDGRADENHPSRDETPFYVSTAGLLSGILFVAIIVAQSIPILFFLTGC